MPIKFQKSQTVRNRATGNLETTHYYIKNMSYDIKNILYYIKNLLYYIKTSRPLYLRTNPKYNINFLSANRWLLFDVILSLIDISFKIG